MIEPLLLTTARVSTFFGSQPLTGATGFFFERETRLYLVTSRHLVIDAPEPGTPTASRSNCTPMPPTWRARPCCWVPVPQRCRA